MLPLLSGLNAVVDYMVVDGSVTNELMAVFAREVMVRGARVAMLRFDVLACVSSCRGARG